MPFLFRILLSNVVSVVASLSDAVIPVGVLFPLFLLFFHLLLYSPLLMLLPIILYVVVIPVGVLFPLLFAVLSLAIVVSVVNAVVKYPFCCIILLANPSVALFLPVLTFCC